MDAKFGFPLMPAIEVMIKSFYWIGKLENQMKRTIHFRWVFMRCTHQRNGESKPDQILLKEVFLATGKTREYDSKSLDLEGVQNYVKESIQQMQNLLSRPEQNHAEESNFDFTEDTTQCAQCNFRKLCPKWHSGDSE